MGVTITQTASPTPAGSGTTISYSGVSIGTASDDRIVCVPVGAELASGQPLSATIDYGAGALAMNTTTLATQGAVFHRTFWLPAPTGTTATIAVTFNASQGSTTHKISVYAVKGGTVESSGSNNSTDMDSTVPLTTGSITVRSQGGILLSLAKAQDTINATWANATGDIAVDAGTFQYQTATRVTSLTTTAITATGTTNQEDGAMSWILFRLGIVANAGSYAFTGTAITPRHGFKVAADVGSYSFGGQTVNLLHKWKAFPDVGAYQFSGTDVTLRQARKLVADAGAYQFTGTAVNLTKSGAGGPSYGYHHFIIP